MTTAATLSAPVRRASGGIPFARLVRVEWGKATDTRAARWLLGLTALATVAIELAPLLAEHSIDQTVSAYLLFAAFGLATLLPVVAILTLTSEWSQRTVLTTFVQEPRRARVVGAKVAVTGLLTVAAVVVGALVTAAAVGVAAASGRDVANDLGAAKAAGFVLFVAANMAMGVAFGAVLQNSAAAIVLFFLLPTAFGFLGAAAGSIGRWVDPGTTYNWLLEGHFGGHLGGLVVTTLVWVVAPLAAGVVRTVRREIS